MNKGIPSLFFRLGITAYFQDMVPADSAAAATVKPLVEQVLWNYASKIWKPPKVLQENRDSTRCL